MMLNGIVGLCETGRSKMEADALGSRTMLFHRKLFAAMLAVSVVYGGVGLASPVLAQAEQQAAPPAEDAAADLEVTTEKFNAYVSFMNRSLRAVTSIERYKSWVNMKKGPTGKERIIYGLYEVYDTKDEAAAATDELTKAPLIPELDSAMRDYIAANAVLGPILNEANGYYERKDYLADKMAEGKALHAKIVPAAETFLAARARLEAVFKVEKAKVDQLQLAAIEQREGKKANWHVKNVMVQARDVMDLMPSNAKPVVDLPTFDAALTKYAGAVKEMDTYGSTNSNAFFTFTSMPRDLLGKLREFREKLGRAKGDARRGAGDDITWIVNDYNMMVSSSQNATMFSK